MFSVPGQNKKKHFFSIDPVHCSKSNLNLGINTKPPTAGGDATRCTRTCILSCCLTNLVLKITFSFSSDISLGYLCKISAWRDIKRSAKYCRIMMEICTPGWKHSWWPRDPNKDDHHHWNMAPLLTKLRTVLVTVTLLGQHD